MLRGSLQAFWFTLGCTAVGIGAIGLFLPVMPTVPFMILGAYAFARSSERVHRWLLTHHLIGPPIRDWLHRGAVAKRMKWISSVSMAVSVAIALLLQLPPVLIGIQAVVLTVAAIFIWTRPDS